MAGFFITIGGLVGNISHWLVGRWVQHLGPRADSPSGYYSLYATLAVFILASLLALPCLHAIGKREKPAPEVSPDPAAAAVRNPQFE